MQGSRRRGGAPAWLTVHEIAEHVYCPRALHYYRNPPSGGPSASSMRRSRAGTEFHDRVLERDLRESSRARPLGIVLLVGLFLLGFGAWLWLHP